MTGCPSPPWGPARRLLFPRGGQLPSRSGGSRRHPSHPPTAHLFSPLAQSLSHGRWAFSRLPLLPFLRPLSRSASPSLVEGWRRPLSLSLSFFAALCSCLSFPLVLRGPRMQQVMRLPWSCGLSCSAAGAPAAVPRAVQDGALAEHRQVPRGHEATVPAIRQGTDAMNWWTLIGIDGGAKLP